MPVSNPGPPPGISATVKSAIALLTYDSVNSCFTDGTTQHFLYLQKGSTRPSCDLVEDTVAHANSMGFNNPVLLVVDSTTANVLRTGTLNQDSTITAGGSTYQMEVQLSGNTHVLVAVTPLR